MAEQKLVYRNSDGVRRTAIADTDDPNRFTVKTEVDCTQLVDNNRALGEFQLPFSTNKLIARVPLTIYEKSIHENWDEDDWRKWLNDSENVHFRVWKGRV